MICLYEKDETVFTGNGICVLSPSVCRVSEVAGGSYLLHMEHPIDKDGKFSMLTEERIIKAPVPPMHVQAITLPDVKIWQTIATAPLYSVLPATKRIPCAEDIKKVKQSPGLYSWRSYTLYKQGSLVTYAQGIYRARTDTFNAVPTGAAGVWNYETTVAGSGDTIEQTGGTVIETLASGVMVTKIADYNSTYMQIKSLGGNTGYVERAKCEETQTTESGETLPGFDITEQLFRIYRIGGEDDTQSITIEAKHISYDFQGNGLYSCEITQAEPMTAISQLRGSLLDADDRVIVTDISGEKVNKDWSFLNPVNALLDPDGGLVPTLGAQLIRNNRDYYILSNANPRKGIRLTYGVNLLGVQWERNTENVITRVLPRCGDGNDGILYLPEIYVESEISTEYAYQRTEMMYCSYSVGDEYEKADGTTITLTEETARQQMREDAQARFTTDKADAVEVSLDVRFLLLGDTEEYRQYRGLQNVCMYDLIPVEMKQSGMTATAQVTEYEYDSILKRYNAIRLGDIKAMQKRIPGYRMKKESINLDKLGHDVISKIRSANPVIGQGG